jgi:hypothetical protein
MEKLLKIGGFGLTENYLIKPVVTNLSGSIGLYTLEPRTKTKQTYLLLEQKSILEEEFICLPVSDRDPTVSSRRKFGGLPLYIQSLEDGSKNSTSLGTWTFNVNCENPIVDELRHTTDMNSRDLSKLLLYYGDNNFNEFFSDMVKFGKKRSQ